MHLMLKCILATQNKMYASNAFFAQPKCILCIKCIFALQQNVMQKYIFAKHQMHFCIQQNVDAEHFPKENVLQKCIFAIKCIFAKHQMHFCKAYIFLWKMLHTKCDAEHFPKENVRKNAFLHQIYFCKASNAFVTFCLLNIFQRKMFSKTKCDAEHFPLENVRKNAFLHQIYFCKASNAFVTFCFAEHFFKENVHAPAKCKGTAKAEKCCVFCFAKSKKTNAHCKKQRQCAHFTGALRTFDFAKMYLMLLCFLHSKKQRQCVHFVGAEHFPLENVQHQQNLTHQMHFDNARKSVNTCMQRNILFLNCYYVLRRRGFKMGLPRWPISNPRRRHSI